MRAGSVLDEPLFTRREGDILRTAIAEIDQHGTRSQQLLAGQLDRLAEQLAQLRGDVTSRWQEHGRQHARERRERASARRWRITTAIAAAAALAAVLGLLWAILASLAAVHR